MSVGPRIVVVGAGITGLTAAYRLSRLRPDASIIVLEASDHAGGKILTTPFAGLPAVDAAADAFIARVPAAVDLCREVGLGDELITPAVRSAFIYRGGNLGRIPEGIVLGVPTDIDALRASSIISSDGINRAERDLIMPADVDDPIARGDDESVGHLVRRRVGNEVFESLVAPLLSGVHAGDSDELSVAVGAPQLAAAVRDQPSLIAGLRKQRTASVHSSADTPVFYGLRRGTQSLIDALIMQLEPQTLCLDTSVSSIAQASSGGFVVSCESTGGKLPKSRTIQADAVVLAIPSFAAADLIRDFAGDLSGDLDTLEWASVVLVTFAIPRLAIAHPLDGSGFLVAEGEGLLMTACSWSSSKWAHLSQPNTAILRVSVGRHHDRRAIDLDDAELINTLLGELGETIGLDPAASGLTTRVKRWNRSLPQFRPGHLERARRWKESARTIAPGLELAGASYFGLGIPACIADADAAVAALVEQAFVT